MAALQAELAVCRSMAGHRAYVRHVVEGTGAVVVLALGFTLGLYSESLKKAAVDAGVALGLVTSRPDVGDGQAAYQKGNYATALRLLRPLADGGDVQAQSILGLMYYHGRGVEADDLEALKWFRLAAHQGDPRAQFNLAVAYAEGHGVPQDYAEAVTWYRRAASQNHAQAQYNLGLLYARGEGVAQDNVSAHMWFNLAAAAFPASDISSRSLAGRNRDLLARKMTPEQIAEAQRLAREWRSN
jgi:TPR repeat protein